MQIVTALGQTCQEGSCTSVQQAYISHFTGPDCNGHLCCVELAPNNFKMGESLSAYVFKQPDTADEEAQCRQALAACPTAAIHDDGLG
jgi:ferredoxin